MTTLTKTQLTQHLAVTRNIVDRLVSEGLPGTADTAGRLRFDVDEVARWLLARSEATGGGPGVERERERLIKSQADRGELELGKARGELIEAATVARAWSQTFRVIRDLLRSIPRSSADRLMAVAVEGRGPFAAAMLEEIDDALRRASTTPVNLKNEDETNDAA